MTRLHVAGTVGRKKRRLMASGDAHHSISPSNLSRCQVETKSTTRLSVSNCETWQGDWPNRTKGLICGDASSLEILALSICLRKPWVSTFIQTWFDAAPTFFNILVPARRVEVHPAIETFRYPFTPEISAPNPERSETCEPQMTQRLQIENS
jgi:hypothetical protein